MSEQNLELNFTMTQEKIFCEYGELEYCLDDKTAIVNSLNVYMKRVGIGSMLVKQFEELSLKEGCLQAEVPASQTKEALSFWKNLNYASSIQEDNLLLNKIIKSRKNKPWETSQGVIVLQKQIA